jgi:hypothetical protein
MSFLIGFLVYVFGVLFFCALTRANGPDPDEAGALPRRIEERFGPAPRRSGLPAPEARS